MSENRRKSSSWFSMALQASAGPIGLVLGYIILCQFGPQYDFLRIWHGNDQSKAPQHVRKDVGWPNRKGAPTLPDEKAQKSTALPITNPPPTSAVSSAATPPEADPDSMEVATRSPGAEAAISSLKLPGEKLAKSENQPPETRDSESSQEGQNLLPFASVGELQRAVGKPRTAKQVLQLLSGAIADTGAPDDARSYARSQWSTWEQRAADDYIRLGESWMPRSEAVAKREKANELLNQAAGLLNLDSDQQALERLNKAAKLDPEATTAVFLLGVHYALGLKNYQEAKECFSDCLHRRPDDVGALNDLGIACLMLGRHSEALKNFRAAVAIAPRSVEVAHNVRRILKQDGLKSVVLPPPVKNGFVELLNSAANGDPTIALDTFGWLYLIPAVAPAGGGLAPELSNVLPRFGQSKLDKTVRIHAQWIEDCQCPWCRGTGRAPCTNPECNHGQVVVKTGQEVVGKDPLTKKNISHDVFGPKNCPTCKGTGYLNCDKCSGLRTDPTLSGIRIEVTKQ